MRHQNSVFHSLTKYAPWGRFDQIVENYEEDKLVRRLTTKRHFVALLFGQFSGAASVRKIGIAMESHEARVTQGSENWTPD